MENDDQVVLFRDSAGNVRRVVDSEIVNVERLRGIVAEADALLNPAQTAPAAPEAPAVDAPAPEPAPAAPEAPAAPAAPEAPAPDPATAPDPNAVPAAPVVQ